MSQENVDTVLRAVAAVNARDLEGYLSCCTETVELHTPVEPVAGAYAGRADIERFFADIEDAAPDFRIDIHSLQAIGRDHVLASIRTSSTGRSSGISLDAEATNVYDLINGRISRLRIFPDRAEALKAVGLEE
jgi:ketosteroid isomerase-like protein